MFYGEKLSKPSQICSLEPRLQFSITDIDEAMTTLSQEGQSHSENCITVKVSRRTQEFEIYLGKEEGSGLEFISTDLRHFFRSNVANEFGVMLRRKGPHRTKFASDLVRIDSLMTYTDLIDYIIVGDTKTPLLRYFPFISKLKPGEIITTGQYRYYQTFSNLQFRPLLKNSFHSFHVDLRDTSAEKNPLFLSVSLDLFWCSEVPPTVISNLKEFTKWLLQDKSRFYSKEVLVDNVYGDSMHLHKLLGER